MAEGDVQLSTSLPHTSQPPLGRRRTIASRSKAVFETAPRKRPLRHRDRLFRPKQLVELQLPVHGHKHEIATHTLGVSAVGRQAVNKTGALRGMDIANNLLKDYPVCRGASPRSEDECARPLLSDVVSQAALLQEREVSIH
jgi:hypothetical protein